MNIWIDTNNCEEHFHEIKDDGVVWSVYHNDGTECEDTEFMVKEEE